MLTGYGARVFDTMATASEDVTVSIEVEPSTPPGYLSAADAARRLGISRQAVIARIQRGTLPAIKQAAGGWRGWRYIVREADIQNV